MLVAVDNSHSEYSFNIANTFINNHSTKYLQGVEHDGILFQPDPVWYDLWGWTYRVNDEFPVEEFTFTYESGATTLAYQGTYISDTYVKDGDVVHFFIDDPEVLYGYHYASEYIGIENVSASIGSVSATVNFHVAEHRTYFYLDDPTDPTSVAQGLQLCLGPVTAKAGQVVYLYAIDANGTPTTQIASGVTQGNGSVTISSANIVAGSYALITESEILYDMDEPADYSGFRFTQTTGYAIVTVA